VKAAKSNDPSNRREFWDANPGLIWSNRDAPDDAFISAALRKGHFIQLVDIAVEFGVDRLERAWKAELSCGDLSAGTIERTENTLKILREANEQIDATSHSPAVGTA